MTRARPWPPRTNPWKRCPIAPPHQQLWNKLAPPTHLHLSHHRLRINPSGPTIVKPNKTKRAHPRNRLLLFFPPPPVPLPSPPTFQEVKGEVQDAVFLARPNVPRNATGVLPGVLPQLQVGGLSRPQQTTSGFPNLIAAAVAREGLSTVISALTTTGLRSTIESPDFTGTLFLPANEAFAVLLSNLGVSLDSLFQDVDRLRSILLYHVVPTVLFEEQLDHASQFSTLEGNSLTVSRDDDGVSIIGVGSQGKIITPDIVAGDGVFHVIDGVLLPYSVPF
eukprot:TRINITY_DN5777_c0_g1_i3.p3 TRINITY_DN5777_c0_g1~~TRINITY_DN5777_c0_g1_i3.p3  ORF type:complete len:278 (-),score=37.14 TRINITY_DN5777_c0_g1_i3:1288-2121(-)